MIINDGGLYSIIQQYRIAWINGPFGGGKTSLAFKLAADLMDIDGRFRLIASVPNVWQSDYGDVNWSEDGKLNCIFILDEGGLVYSNEAMVRAVAAYARRMNCIYLIPSVWNPAPVAQKLQITALYGFQSIGLPISAYRWSIKNGTYEDNHNFFWVDPSEIYGVYSNDDFSDDGADIVSFVSDRIEKRKKIFGSSTRYKPAVDALQKLEKEWWDVQSN